jgi:hypothetical protein
MSDDKYLKTEYGNFPALFSVSDVNRYTLEEYEAALLNHLAEVKKRVAEFIKSKKVGNVQLSISFEGSYETPGVAYSEYSLIGYRPMNKTERKQADQYELNRQKNEEKVEKQKLAYLLNKYPDFKP